MRPPAFARAAVWLMLAVHVLLLLCYTFPQEWVPTRQRFWSQAYARLVFHQDWRLFAPDPPSCTCAIEVRPEADSAWLPLSDVHDHFIWRRMAANACRFTEASFTEGDTIVRAPFALTASLERMAEDLPRKGPLLFRWRSGCLQEPVGIALQPHR